MTKTKIVDEEKNVSRNYQEHSAKLKKFLSEYMELNGTSLGFYLTAINKSIEEKGILGLDNNQKKRICRINSFPFKTRFPFCQELNNSYCRNYSKKFF